MDILTEEQLDELFENPKKIIRQVDKEPSTEAQESIGVSDMEVHRDEDGEKYIKYKRNGVYEVHHMDSHVNSGEYNGNTKFNPSFISTMMELVKPHLEKGNTVCISSVAKHGMPEQYHRIAKALVKKFKYNMLITPIGDHPTDEKMKIFHIQPAVEEAVLMVQTAFRNDILIEWRNKYDS